jgi:hypothetical protein
MYKAGETIQKREKLNDKNKIKRCKSRNDRRVWELILHAKSTLKIKNQQLSWKQIDYVFFREKKKKSNGDGTYITLSLQDGWGGSFLLTFSLTKKRGFPQYACWRSILSPTTFMPFSMQDIARLSPPSLFFRQFH